MDEFLTAGFWVAVGQIIMIDIVLGGDNAVVIALACRKLPPAQRTKGILWGTAGAIILRVILIFFALTLLAIPYLKVIGALLLLWIGIKLLLPEDEDGGHNKIEASDKLWAAVKTVIVADFVMSLDNVIAIAGAAEGSGDHKMALVIFGLLVSIPIIVWGSQLVIRVMDRYPIIITLGGMLLGWIAGTMAVTDPAVLPYVPTVPAEAGKLPDAIASVRYGAGIAGALIVLAVGKWLSMRRTARAAPAPAAAPGTPGHLQRVVLAVDGSEYALQAVRHMLALRDDLRAPEALDLHLVNVQRSVSGDVSTFVAGETLDEYYRERSESALAPARALLDAAGVTYKEHLRVGSPGPAIAEVARSLSCDLIVMGTRGLDSRAAVLLGSVAQTTVEHSSVPVLLVK